jgi:hypothetical protein
MASDLLHNILINQVEAKKKDSLFKLLIVFFALIINIDTVSYVLLRTDAMVSLYQKLFFTIVLFLSFIFFFKWRRTDRTCFLLFVILLAKLVIESLIRYHSILIYPSVVAVMFPFLYVYFTKNLFRFLHIEIFKILIASIFFGYIVFMVFNGSDFDFSNTPLIQENGPYSGDTRILHANSILLLVLPFLYFLNQILSVKKSYVSIAGFAASFIIIVIHQHRTVWLITIFSTVLLLFMKGGNKGMLKRIFLFILVTIGVFGLLMIAIPGLGQLFVERFMDVLDPLNEDNTGGFRYLQILSYLNYFIQKPLFGWTFSGFDLSNPFIDNWDAGTGHHFHDAYIEVLFYFGITGLLLKFFPLYSIAKKIRKQLSDKSKVLAAFSVSGFVYAFGYVPPLIFWGIVGLCLYYIDKDLRDYNYTQLQKIDGETR